MTIVNRSRDLPILPFGRATGAAMVELRPEISEMECNPVIVRPEGAVIVDARIRIEAVVE